MVYGHFLQNDRGAPTSITNAAPHQKRISSRCLLLVCSWHTVIPTHTGAAEGSSDIILPAVIVEFSAGVLRSAVAVEYHTGRGVPPAQGHVQSINDEAGPHVVGDRPAHDGS